MAVKSIVKLSELEGAKRFDAEFYQLEYLEFAKTIKNSTNWIELRRLATNVICGPFGSAILEANYRKEGIPLIRVADLKTWFAAIDNLVFIEEKLSESLKRYQVFSGDIVVSQRGTIAMFSLVTGDFPKWNISANLISIKKSKKINFSYLLTFLNSYYGHKQLFRKLSGQVQPKITTDDVKELFVFVPSSEFQNQIKKIIEEAFKEQKESEKFYSLAENFLLDDLGLSDFKPKYELSYAANLSKAFGVHRVDAEYFQPAYDGVIKKITKYSNGYTPLLASGESVKPDFDPKRYPDRTFSYVELADIDVSIGTIHSVSEVKGEEAPSRARRTLRKNDVIVSSVEGSLEKVALVDEDYEGSLASTGFFQFRPTKILPEVLLVLSKSIVLQAQLKKECAGTILTAVPGESLKRILVPKLSDKIQRKIARLIQQSHEARRKAEELLKEAEKKVEGAIEKSK